jgi:hypothetical protein
MTVPATSPPATTTSSAACGAASSRQSPSRSSLGARRHVPAAPESEDGVGVGGFRSADGEGGIHGASASTLMIVSILATSARLAMEIVTRVARV